MRTTLTLDEDVAERLIEYQEKHGLSFKQAVNDTLRLGLEREARPRKAVPAFKIHARELGLRPGLHYDNIGDLLEQVEGAIHA